MRYCCSSALVFLAMASLSSPGLSPAWAGRLPDPNAVPQTEHQMLLRYADTRPQPYAMNYTEEAARTLGVKDGKWEAFSTQSRDPLMPRFRGSIDQGRAMIGLQWRQ